MGQTRAKYSLQPATNREYPGAGGNTLLLSPILHTPTCTLGAILLICSTESSYKPDSPGVVLIHEQNSLKYALQKAWKYTFKNNVESF